jgi:hypothetical protein
VREPGLSGGLAFSLPLFPGIPGSFTLGVEGAGLADGLREALAAGSAPAPPLSSIEPAATWVPHACTLGAILRAAWGTVLKGRILALEDVSGSGPYPTTPRFRRD